MKFLKAIVIDDDATVRNLISLYLQNVEGIELINSFPSAKQAAESIELEEADLIFLDMEMPELDGREFISKYHPNAAIVVVTSNQEYAYWGFQNDAIDFLLKPITVDRFNHAINKVFFMKPLLDMEEELVFKSGTDYFKVRRSEILYVEGANEYLKIVTTTGRFLVYSNMKDMLERLGEGFERIHRSYIVAMDKVDHFSKHNVFIKGHNLKVSKSYSHVIKQLA